MIAMTLQELAKILNVSLTNNTAFTGISIDSRTLSPGNLFIAIIGESTDGHHYLAEAAAKGAVAVVASRPVETTLPQILVQDTTAALGQIGTAWRKQFNLPIIAVTGSNGKTTLKNMIANILLAAANNNGNEVLATQGTLNNQWGLPLTLARLGKEHRYAVIEMGMNHFGEIDYLTHLTSPTVATITNAAACHLEGLGDIAGVARAKGEIFGGLATDGIAVLNRDDAFFPYWHGIIGEKRFITFGYHPDADVRTDYNDEHKGPLTVETPSGVIMLTLPLIGKHNVTNSLAAIAATLAINIHPNAIKQGIETTKPAPGRLQLHELVNDVKIIDDTYNANPFSLQAAVNALTQFAGKKILVLGDMRELGPEAESLHFAAGENIRKAGVDFLFTYGELSAQSAQAFGEGAYHFSDQEKLLQALQPLLQTAVTILVKGSRSMRMEKVVQGLVDVGKEQSNAVI